MSSLGTSIEFPKPAKVVPICLPLPVGLLKYALIAFFHFLVLTHQPQHDE